MYTKIINPKIHGKTTFSNTASCASLANYLSKENESLELDEREMFFNHLDNELSSNAVINMIDNNTKGIAKDRTKFHSLVIAPDTEELAHIGHSPEKLKEYTIRVMDEYAKGFNIKDKNLSVDDLVWAAKLEHNRNGDFNNGNNMHIHVIVSARDAEQKIHLSPNNNNKKRFNRVNFYLNSEKAFDNMFNYERIESKLTTDQVKKHGTLDQKELYFNNLQNKRNALSNKLSLGNLLKALSPTPGNHSNEDEYEEEKKRQNYNNSKNI